MFADKKTCKHRYLEEKRRVSGFVTIVFERDTDMTESHDFDTGAIRQPKKWCYCSNCGQRFVNPRWLNLRIQTRKQP